MEKFRILVIDDSLEFLNSIRRVIQRGGPYDVHTTDAPATVAEQIDAIRPHLIVLDMMMPRIGGLDVCAVLNEHAFGRNIPVVVITGDDKEVDRQKALELGVQAYLSKLSSNEEILSVIGRVIRQRYGDAE